MEHPLSPSSVILLSPDEQEGGLQKGELSSDIIPQTPAEIADSINKIANQVHFFGKSAVEVAKQAARRVRTFRGWVRVRNQTLELKPRHAYGSALEERQAISHLLAFNERAFEKSQMLHCHLGVVKRLVELFATDEKLPNSIPYDDVIAIWIMAWVVINHASDLEMGFNMVERAAWNANLVAAIQVDTDKLYQITTMSCSNMDDQSIEFYQIYRVLLGFFTQHVGVKHPKSGRYSISGLMEVIIYHFPMLREIGNALSRFLPQDLHGVPDSTRPNNRPLVIRAKKDSLNGYLPLSSRCEDLSSLRSDIPCGDVSGKRQEIRYKICSSDSNPFPTPDSPAQTPPSKIQDLGTGHSESPDSYNYPQCIHPTSDMKKEPYPRDTDVPGQGADISGLARSSIVSDLNRTYSNNRPTVFVLALEPSKLRNSAYSSLLSSMCELANVVHFSTFPDFFRELDTIPSAVLILEPTIIQPRYTTVRARLVQYVMSGGKAVYGGIFCSMTPKDDMGVYFGKDWSLPWKAGSRRRTTVSLKPRLELQFMNNSRLCSSYSMDSLCISGIRPEDAMYVASQDLKAKSHALLSDSSGGVDECPIAFVQVDRGFLGYVGDLNVEEGSLEVYLTMLGLRDT